MSIPPKLPDLALLNEIHQFPTMFTFKVVGDHHEDFLTDVLNQVLIAVGDTRVIEHSVRLSAKGSHAAVSLNVHCLTADEVHVVYTRLLKVQGLRTLF
ncbi:MAG: DUF493 domain-containing protein [Proteobacteria bacterium]|nr:DUF493 domain-containing protein [Pseudomonadota bacterium]